MTRKRPTWKTAERAALAIIVLLLIGIGALLWATLPDSEPAQPITTTTAPAAGYTGAAPPAGCEDLAEIGAYLLEPGRFADPTDGPYVQAQLADTKAALGC